MFHNLYPLAEKHIDSNYERLLTNLKTLAAIGAPSHDEGRRAEWIKQYMESFGAEGVYIDSALNVIFPYNTEGCNELIVFAAHSDVVFPDTGTLPVSEDDEKIYAPGIGDNTTSVSCMLELVRFFLENDIKPRNGFLFVIDAAEEGLGNLIGIKQIMKDFEGCIKEVIAIDGSNLERFVNDAVGSKRYRVEIKTEGGHSYGAFGNKNAIYYMSSLVTSLYAMKVPPIGKTTYNVGLINGGTSVNTIAQQCDMVYEYRSDKREALTIMDDMFFALADGYRKMGIEVNIELLGDRPCKGDVDVTALSEKVCNIAALFNLKPTAHASSTDCNIPLSVGIPSVCLSTYRGKGAHTREEFIYKHSMREGMRFIACFMLSYVD